MPCKGKYYCCRDKLATVGELILFSVMFICIPGIMLPSFGIDKINSYGDAVCKINKTVIETFPCSGGSNKVCYNVTWIIDFNYDLSFHKDCSFSSVSKRAYSIFDEIKPLPQSCGNDAKVSFCWATLPGTSNDYNNVDSYEVTWNDPNTYRNLYIALIILSSIIFVAGIIVGGILTCKDRT